MKPKIGIVTLGVKDVKASAQFYKKLGFPVHSEQDPYVMFSLEGTWLALYPKDKLAEDAQVDKLAEGFPSFTLAHNESSKEAVDKAIEEARSAGAEIMKEPQDVFWGGYSGYFRDPDGYLWEVAFNPFEDLT